MGKAGSQQDMGAHQWDLTSLSPPVPLAVLLRHHHHQPSHCVPQTCTPSPGLSGQDGFHHPPTHSLPVPQDHQHHPFTCWEQSKG